MKPNRRQILLSSGALLALPHAAWAQAKPAIRILVGFPPGGATDAIARTVADRLPNLLGQPVIIDNKPGVGGRMAADAVLSAPADGLTFMVAPNATPTFQMLVFGHQIRWNILKDFTPVATVASYPLGMGVALS
ncbi:MAG: tripartite tricarboxylate transporter substrate-binding protein, partial [Hydrogenophaga sp.]|nr:tripartite tricarboxylate transporter substrate-binding protein [Hydrogenophaga sp.]